ncbi:MAG: hypothetical protein NBV67_12255 [Tagaea sp.]|nr:hypothetical protein [Tagaea sp.]
MRGSFKKPDIRWRELADDQILVHLADRGVRAVTPGTAIATFAPDKNANGELRYPSPEGQTRAEGERIRRHAGIFMGYGEQGGRPGIFILDQFDGAGRQRGDQGRTGVRFLPFERSSGQGGYLAGEFHVIGPKK